MRPTHYRAARLEVRYRREELVSAVDHILTYFRSHAETVGLYVAVCAFWGLIAYTALASVALS